jgi:hypothetical protein
VLVSSVSSKLPLELKCFTWPLPTAASTSPLLSATPFASAAGDLATRIAAIATRSTASSPTNVRRGNSSSGAVTTPFETDTVRRDFLKPGTEDRIELTS